MHKLEGLAEGGIQVPALLDLLADGILVNRGWKLVQGIGQHQTIALKGLLDSRTGVHLETQLRKLEERSRVNGRGHREGSIQAHRFSDALESRGEPPVIFTFQKTHHFLPGCGAAVGVVGLMVIVWNCIGGGGLGGWPHGKRLLLQGVTLMQGLLASQLWCT